MVRQGKYRHNKIITGSQDVTKQVSRDEWNDDLDESGMFGHGTLTTLTIATGAVAPINDMHLIDGESAVDDNLDNITNVDTEDRDDEETVSNRVDMATEGMSDIEKLATIFQPSLEQGSFPVIKEKGGN